jgi:hypothetical protein
VLGSDTLDVAVGLIFLFLLLSLVCSSIKEALETVLKFRARFLYQGIVELFGGANRTDMVDAFYLHPIINALFQGPYDPKKRGNLPAYIPARAFSLVLIDLIHPASERVVSLAAVPEADRAAAAVAQLQGAVAKIDNPSLQRAILPLIAAGENDIACVREHIEAWFNGTMDRVSGWYKRWTQIVIACIGLLLTAFLNVDAISIGRYLYTDQIQRAVIVAQAGTAVQKKGVDTGTALADPLGFIQLQGGVPVGWVLVPEKGQSPTDFQHDWRKMPQSAQSWLLKIAGILLTTFAISLGAPFWFDVLNKIMVIRSTVKPDEKSPDEKSKS